MAEFRWFGHTCFRIRAREATILTDPVGRSTGYALPRNTTADVITLSHEGSADVTLDGLKTDATVLRGPGEYEVHEVFVTGIRTYQDSERGAQRGYNTIYLIEVEGMVICHLGSLGHVLSEEQAEEMTNVDILLVPVGGEPALEPSVAAEIVTRIEPKLVIPMLYATSQGDRKLKGIEPFCKELGVEVPNPEEKLTIRQSELGETVRVVTLQPAA
jgi:L-ascorbate metabolism protein UlaG (beta-lactamase superfamily)